MRWGLSLAVLAGLTACAGGAKKEDLDALEQRMRVKAVEDQKTLRDEITKVREDMSRVEVLAKKFELVAQQIEKGGILTKVDTANTNVLKSLEIQEQYLKQLLESIRALIEELKRK